MTENLIAIKKLQEAKRLHKNATKSFDYTTITDRNRTVGWSEDSIPTDVV